eukprot:752991-Hanusia_phi.AAC.8
MLPAPATIRPGNPPPGTAILSRPADSETSGLAPGPAAFGSGDSGRIAPGPSPFVAAPLLLKPTPDPKAFTDTVAPGVRSELESDSGSEPANH